MTVEGFLYFVARIKGVSASLRKEKVETALSKCNLTDRRHTIIRKLSKGYKQRVGIAQAIVHDPPAIILDEPTVGLDPRQIIDVRNLIKSLAGDHTIILSTHILPEVSMTCSRVAIINQGKIVATNTPENLMTQLTGGSGYEVEIGGEASLAKQVLQNVTAVILVESIPTTATHGIILPERAYLRVVTQPGTEPGSEIAQTLLRAGFDLYEMRRVSATLEDVFLKLTTEEKIQPTESDDEVSELSK